MNYRITILSWALCSAVANPAAAASARHTLTAEQIAAAVSSNGTPIAADQVTFFTNVVASVADPQLKVKSIDPAGDRRVIARLECARPEQCLPFLVTLRTGGSADAVTPQVHVAAVSNAKPAPLVRSGSAATLRLEGPHTHISLTVFCLENGVEGQIIRAATHDRHQVFSVQVKGDGTLEGRL